jgi:hypothetical protein
MPRAAKAERQARQALLATKSAVAEALGVHRNTVTAWAGEGCPMPERGQPVEEFQVRVWVAAHGYQARKDPPAAVTEQLAAAGVRGYAAGSGDAEPVDDDQVLQRIGLLPGVSKYDKAVAKKVITYADAEARERTIKLELANDRARREEEERAGRLVPVERLLEVAGELRGRLDRLAPGFGRRVAERLEDLDRGLVARIIQAADTEILTLLDALVQEAREDD